jgi:hypothetical protein
LHPEGVIQRSTKAVGVRREQALGNRSIEEWIWGKGNRDPPRRRESGSNNTHLWKKEQDHGTERGEIGVEAKRSIGRSFNLHLLDKKRAEEGVLVVLDSGHSDRALGTKGLNRNASEVSGKKEKEGERGGEGKGRNHAAKWASWKYRRRYGRSLGARGGTWGDLSGGWGSVWGAKGWLNPQPGKALSRKGRMMKIKQNSEW